MYRRCYCSHCFIYTILLFLVVPCVGYATNVKDFGAKGDGKTDDTHAIQQAILQLKDGLLEFPKGRYLITQPLSVDLKEAGPLGITGNAGSATLVMAGPGPALRITGSHEGSALPASVKPSVWQNERMPQIEGLEIVGTHPEADGIQLFNTLMPTLRGVLIRDVRHGIHLVSRNRNVLIDACHVYNASGVGIYLDQVNIHQMIISASHISYCKQSGVKVNGGEIRNFHLTGNDIEYNCDPGGGVSAEIWIDCSKGGSVREGSISGSTIQAIPSPGGANIRFTGKPGNPDMIGLWSITGNHIGNQETNIHLDHSRGVTISGNTFMRGYDRHVRMDHSKNIVVNGNVFDHNEAYYTNAKALGGISVFHGQNILFQDNIIERAEYGSPSLGGALVIQDSQQITVSGVQIRNAKHNGIQIDNSSHVRVSDCLILEDAGVNRMSAGILINGPCPNSVIRNNSIGKGKAGYFVNSATGVYFKDNLLIDGEEQAIIQ